MKPGPRKKIHVYRAIVDDWKTGNYTAAALSELWSVGESRIRTILRAGGASAGDKQYRDRRIAELYKAGRSPDDIGAMYGIGAKYVVTIAWKGSGRERDRVCPVCRETFAPRDNRKRYCSLKCRGSKKYLVKICPVCGEAFDTGKQEQTFCGQRCNATFAIIKNVERNIEVREMRRNRYLYRDIAEKFGLSISIVSQICSAGGRQSKYTNAVETIRRHRGRSWMSTMAKQEVRRALHTLKERGLYHYFCLRGA